MSHFAVQRVVVRMLHDAAFARAVYDDVNAATRDCGLSEAERAWLVTPDPRAYAVDPLRRTRALTGLLEEYAVACALLVREYGREHALEALDAFFSSPSFHAGVQHGASLAGCFGAWMAGDSLTSEGGDVRAVVALEAALARARRNRDFAPDLPGSPSSDPTRAALVLAPGVVVHEAPRGLVNRYAAAIVDLRGRGRSLVDAVLDPQHALPGFETGSDVEGVIVDARAPEVHLETATIDLARVLACCAAPIDFGGFVERAAVHGADHEDCVSIAASFASDGLLLFVELA